MADESNGAAPAGSKTLELLTALRGVALPGSASDVVSEGRVKNLSIKDGEVKFNLVLPGPDNAVEDFLEAAISEQLQGLSWITEVELGFMAGPAGDGKDVGASPAESAPFDHGRA